jgi:hypothetical protein
MITIAMPIPAQASQMRRRAARPAGPAGVVLRDRGDALGAVADVVDGAAVAVAGAAVAGAAVAGAAVAGAAPGGGAGISPAALISLLIVLRWSVS